MADSTANFPLRTAGIAGLGLIGGSLALALRARGMHVTGWDRPAVLKAARERAVIDEPASSLAALCGAEITILAVPVGVIMEMLPQLAPHHPRCLTDTGSTKAAIAAQAARHQLAFCGGHPLAGSERNGLSAARADLFHAAPWIFCPPDESANHASNEISADLRARCHALAESAGARPVWLSAPRHDRLMALLSHAPQMISTAMANALARELEHDPEALALAGPGLRSMLRLAGSSYALWRDIALTNRDAISSALSSFEQEIEHLRVQLSTRELERAFHTAGDIYHRSRHE